MLMEDLNEDRNSTATRGSGGGNGGGGAYNVLWMSSPVSEHVPNNDNNNIGNNESSSSSSLVVELLKNENNTDDIIEDHSTEYMVLWNNEDGNDDVDVHQPSVDSVLRSRALLLTVTAIMVAGLTYAMDQIVLLINRSMTHIYDDKKMSHFEKFVCGTLYRLVLLLSACAAAVYIAPVAGSGIPEIRAIMHGRIKLPRYFSLKMLIVKSMSLIAVMGTSFPLGKEGPFIHISTILGQQLNKRWFHCSNRQVLNACVCAGVAACFSAPIGGVLFAIEITSAYFRVAYYITNFATAVVGFAFIEAFDLRPTSLELFGVNKLVSDPYNNKELMWFVLMGAFFGVLGSVYVYIHARVTKLVDETRWIQDHPILFACVVGFVGCVCGYGVDYLRLPYRQTISDLFMTGHLSDATHANDWNTSSGTNISLFVYAVYYFVMSIFIICLEIPSGVFAPCFACGAGFGRLIGQVLGAALGHNYGMTYAVVGASALVSGVTQTISAAVIALELTQQMHLSVPLLVSCVVSAIVSNLINESSYDSQMHLKGVPMLGVKPRRAFRRRKIKSVMVPLAQWGCIESHPSNQDVRALLDAHPLLKCFPIIKNYNLPVLRGEITRNALESFLDCQPMPASLFDDRLIWGVNQSPMQVTVQSSLSYVFRIFHSLNPRTVYVTNEAMLVGVIDEVHLIAWEQKLK